MEGEVTVRKAEYSGFGGFFRKLTRTKVKKEESSAGLSKCLTLTHLYLINLGGTLGGGISVLGLSAAIAGPSVALSFLISGISCLFTSLPYAEFSAKITDTGGAYAFIYASFGEFPAFLIGHSLTLYYCISAAAIARAWASYLGSFLQICGIALPGWLMNIEILSIDINVLSAFLIILFTVMMLFGLKDSATFNNIITSITVLNFIFIIFAGLFFINGEYYGDFFRFGAKGLFASTGLTFFSYVGFCDSCCFIEEAKNPKKDMPRAISMALLTDAVFYIAASFILVGMAPLETLNCNESVVTAFLFPQQTFLAMIAGCGALIGLMSTVFVCLLEQPRIFYGMAKDGLLFKAFAYINQVTKVPQFSTIFSGSLALVVAMFFDLNILGKLVSLGSLVIYAFVDAGVVLSRFQKNGKYSNPSIPYTISLFMIAALFLGFAIQFNWSTYIIIIILTFILACYIILQICKQTNVPTHTFASPLVPAFPLAGVLVNLFLCGSLEMGTWTLYFWFLVGGFVFYFMYSIHFSHMNVDKSPLKIPLLEKDPDEEMKEKDKDKDKVKDE